VEEISKRTLVGHQTNPGQNKQCVKKMDEAIPGRTRRPHRWTRLYRHVRVAAQTALRSPPPWQSLSRPTHASWPAPRHPPRCTAPGGRQRRPRTGTVGPMPSFCGQTLPLQGAWRCAWPSWGGPARCTRMDSCCEAAPSYGSSARAAASAKGPSRAEAAFTAADGSPYCVGPLGSAAPYGMPGPPSAQPPTVDPTDVRLGTHPVPDSVPTAAGRSLHHFLLSSVISPSPAARSGGRGSTQPPRRCLLVCVRWHRRYIRSRRTERADYSFHGAGLLGSARWHRR
jgi:hypothetical protein